MKSVNEIKSEAWNILTERKWFGPIIVSVFNVFLTFMLSFLSMSMGTNNIYITFAILLGFSVIAYIANILLDYNYMFLMRSDGTPYEMFYQLVGGNPILYPLLVVLLFVLYIIVFYAVFLYIKKKKLSK